MEAQTAQPPSAAVAAAAAYPRCVMLEQYSDLAIHKSSRCAGNSSCAAGDAKTLAAARTSLGHQIQFSLYLTDPLAASHLRIIQDPDDAGADEVEYTYWAVAAHDDSLLIHVEQDSDLYSVTDYFIYNAGDAAALPPRPSSLYLLPPCHVVNPDTGKHQVQQQEVDHLNADATGLLHRGDELVVAELRTAKVEDMKLVKVTELCLFRSGEWSFISPTISYGDGDTSGAWEELPAVWHTVGPVGGRRLCWVNLSHNVLAICDGIFQDIPRLQYLRLPVDPCLGQWSNWNSNVCVAAGGGALKFVNIVPHGCCRSAGASNCERSRHAYTIHTWIMRMDDGGMEWVKDGIVNASEIWALDTYKGLPRTPLDHPFVSMDEPHVIYFQLCERRHVNDGDDTLWLLKIDTRCKTIQSVSRREDGFSYNVLTLIPFLPK